MRPRFWAARCASEGIGERSGRGFGKRAQNFLGTLRKRSPRPEFEIRVCDSGLKMGRNRARNEEARSVRACPEMRRGGLGKRGAAPLFIKNFCTAKELFGSGAFEKARQRRNRRGGLARKSAALPRRGARRLRQSQDTSAHGASDAAPIFGRGGDLESPKTGPAGKNFGPRSKNLGRAGRNVGQIWRPRRVLLSWSLGVRPRMGLGRILRTPRDDSSDAEHSSTH